MGQVLHHPQVGGVHAVDGEVHQAGAWALEDGRGVRPLVHACDQVAVVRLQGLPVCSFRREVFVPAVSVLGRFAEETEGVAAGGPECEGRRQEPGSALSVCLETATAGDSSTLPRGGGNGAHGQAIGQEVGTP